MTIEAKELYLGGLISGKLREVPPGEEVPYSNSVPEYGESWTIPLPFHVTTLTANSPEQLSRETKYYYNGKLVSKDTSIYTEEEINNRQFSTGNWFERTKYSWRP